MSILSLLTKLQVRTKLQIYKSALTAAAELDGISGSWVVQEGEHEIQVYGQVVAKDAFGDVYIMPMVDILHDVEKVFNGRIASLHGHSLVAQESKDGKCPYQLRSTPR